MSFPENGVHRTAGEGEAPKRERKAKAAKKERSKKEDDDAMKANVVGKFSKDEEE